MAKSQKELAFLNDLYIGSEWTSRFTDLLDKHVRLADEENILYINAGTGDHVFALRERLGEKTAVFATSENEDTLTIARDKGAAIGSDVDFSDLVFEDDSFGAVVADGTFVGRPELSEFIREAVRVAKPKGSVAIVLVSAGSFGEIFSLLWEVLFEADLGQHGAAAEKLIADQPTVSEMEELCAKLGLRSVKTETAKEIFEYNDGTAFISSSLVVDFLIPKWLQSLSENEKEQVTNKLAQLIDAEDADLTFRFTVKATLITGVKA